MTLSFSNDHVYTVESVGSMGKNLCDRCHKGDVIRVTLTRGSCPTVRLYARPKYAGHQVGNPPQTPPPPRPSVREGGVVTIHVLERIPTFYPIPHANFSHLQNPQGLPHAPCSSRTCSCIHRSQSTTAKQCSHSLAGCVPHCSQTGSSMSGIHPFLSPLTPTYTTTPLVQLNHLCFQPGRAFNAPAPVG